MILVRRISMSHRNGCTFLTLLLLVHLFSVDYNRFYCPFSVCPAQTQRYGTVVDREQLKEMIWARDPFWQSSFGFLPVSPNHSGQQYFPRDFPRDDY